MRRTLKSVSKIVPPGKSIAEINAELTEVHKRLDIIHQQLDAWDIVIDHMEAGFSYCQKCQCWSDQIFCSRCQGGN